jgi:hypothetical protein
MVAKGYLENTKSKYNALSKLVVNMRYARTLPWDAMEDRARRVTDKKGYEDKDKFGQVIGDYLSKYSRCLVQGQEKYVELWIEKDALSRIYEEVAWPYCIRAVICRGYASVTFLNEFKERAEKAISKGQQPVILYFGDFDPSGIQMLEATKQTLEDDMGLWGIEFIRIALNPEQVSQYQLPHNFAAVKSSDTRSKRFIERFGYYGWELDALHPQVQEDLAKSAIESQFDMELFQEQKQIEKIERAKIEKFRQKFLVELKNL